MKKLLLILCLIYSFFSCQNSKTELNENSNEVATNNDSIAIIINDSILDAYVPNNSSSDTITENKISEFIPKGYKLFEKIQGDLNKDGNNDCVLIIKEVNKENIVNVENRGDLDRNRRGIIVLLNEKGKFKQFIKNLACFSSENEDGGIYFAPEMSLEIKKGNLYVHYGHGRYGYWKYTFRIKNSDLDLIGYDSSSNTGPVVNSETSINYLTNKRIIKTNTNDNADSGEEVFEEKMYNLEYNPQIKLSKIKDFDELELEAN